MSDSYVNDIRYTALWRPVVKARVAPATSLSSPSSLVRSVRSFSFSEISRYWTAFPFSVSLFQNSPRRSSSSARTTTISQAGSSAGMRTTANSICPDGESVCFCRGGSPTATASRIAPASIATVRTIACNSLPLMWEYTTLSFVDSMPLYVDLYKRSTFVRFSEWLIKPNSREYVFLYSQFNV